jgi:hypothetical protein
MRKSFFCRLHERNNVHIHAFPHHQMVQEESVLILHHTYSQSQLLLPIENSSADLIDLPYCMPHVILYRIVGYDVQPMSSERKINRPLCFPKIGFRRIGVLPMSLCDPCILLFNLLPFLCSVSDSVPFDTAS